MSDISPIGPSGVATGARTTRHHNNTPATTTTSRGGDRVELSSAAQLKAQIPQLLSKINALPDVRQDLVDRVKAQIANNTYETSDKIDAAISKLGEDVKG
jgi:anti-sigma28 factor (negative regulator of flagellin synthesis)